MKRVLLIVIACAVVAVWSAAVLAQETPWSKPGAEKPEEKAVKPAEKAPGADVKPAAGDAGGVNLQTAIPEADYKRLITPITSFMEQAEKVLANFDKEMAKEKADEKRANGFKIQAARFYVSANLKARQAVAAMTKADLKAAIAAQFEKPALDKAIQIYMEQAERAVKAKDYPAAEGYYREVLKLDKENADAKAGLERIAQEKKAAGEAAKKGQGAGGKDDNERVWDPSLQPAKDPAGTSGWKKDHTKTGQGGWKN